MKMAAAHRFKLVMGCLVLALLYLWNWNWNLAGRSMETAAKIFLVRGGAFTRYSAAETGSATMRYQKTAAIRFHANSTNYAKFADDQGGTVRLSPQGTHAFVSGYHNLDTIDPANMIYMFERTRQGWVFKDVVFSCERGYQRMTFEISGDGESLVVGCSQNNHRPACVRVLYLENKVWKLDRTVLQSDYEERKCHTFGTNLAVSFSGRVIVVGEPPLFRFRTNGTVYVFQKMFTVFGNSFWRKQVLLSSETWLGEEYGNKLAISGDGSTLAVALYRPNHYPLLFMFQRDFYGSFQKTSVITESTLLPSDAGPCFSLSLSYNGRVCVLGACQYVKEQGAHGVLTIYVRNLGATEWSESERLTSQDNEGKVAIGRLTLLSSEGTVILTCGSNSCWIFAKSEEGNYVQQGPRYTEVSANKSCDSPCLRFNYGRSAHLVGDASAFIVGGSERNDWKAFGSDGGGSNIYQRIHLN